MNLPFRKTLFLLVDRRRQLSMRAAGTMLGPTVPHPDGRCLLVSQKTHSLLETLRELQHNITLLPRFVPPNGFYNLIDLLNFTSSELNCEMNTNYNESFPAIMVSGFIRPQTDPKVPS